MPIIARFNLAAEAAFFQTLLEEKGIPVTLFDSGSGALGLNNVATTDVDVPDDYVAQATAIYVEYSKDNTIRADRTEDTHPNKGFPFFALWVGLTLASWLLAGIFWLASETKTQTSSDILGIIGVLFIGGIFGGLAMAWTITLWRTMLIFVLRRFKK